MLTVLSYHAYGLPSHWLGLWHASVSWNWLREETEPTFSSCKSKKDVSRFSGHLPPFLPSCPSWGQSPGSIQLYDFIFSYSHIIFTYITNFFYSILVGYLSWFPILDIVLNTAINKGHRCVTFLVIFVLLFVFYFLVMRVDTKKWNLCAIWEFYTSWYKGLFILLFMEVELENIPANSG